jgi:serine/threonine-protein kinase
MTPAAAPPPSRPSRYATLLKLASGGMASVWVGTVRGGLGFRQLVAIKKPHPHLVETAEHRAELLAEAALASSIHHANVVDVRDVEVVGDEVSLVMDYVEGASLSEILGRLQSKGGRLPPGCALRICLDALAGLHAAHELHDDRGRPVGLVHRDVSPQNVLVGTDGIARVVDFGVAKFRKKDHSTTTGQLKGKIAYMSPEYLRNEAIDRRLDVFAMGVVLWESLTGRRLFRGAHDADTLQNVLGLKPGKVAELVPEAAAIDAVLEGALAKDPSQRFASAAAMSAALESAARSAGIVGSPRDVSAVVLGLFGDELAQRRETIREKLVNEPSVASLFEGARLTPVRAPVLGDAARRCPRARRGRGRGRGVAALVGRRVRAVSVGARPCVDPTPSRAGLLWARPRSPARRDRGRRRGLRRHAPTDGVHRTEPLRGHGTEHADSVRGAGVDGRERGLVERAAACVLGFLCPSSAFIDRAPTRSARSGRSYGACIGHGQARQGPASQPLRALTP